MRPRRVSSAEQMAAMPELADPAMPAYDLHEYAPLLDSSNMQPADWVRIGQDIVAHYDAYDGFIVLHGTDTMAYTASALPFFLRGLAKPVIITGSQIPLAEVRNDARANLIASMWIAARAPVPEVCLYFGNKLLRGCRATKVDADGLDAFDSPNYLPLGTVGVSVEIDRSRLAHPAYAGPLAPVWPVRPATVGVPACSPGCHRTCWPMCSSRRCRGWRSWPSAWVMGRTATIGFSRPSRRQPHAMW